MSAIQVLIVDDHALLREGIKQLIGLTSDIAVAGEAADGDGALRRLAEGGVDLLLLDLVMPGLCGEDLIAEIHGRYPALPILVLSMHAEPAVAERALKAGAAGYLTKENGREMLLSAIRKVAVHARFLDPSIAEYMAFSASGVIRKGGHECLTEREYQIMRLLANGFSVNDIATRLVISNKTVSTHKARLMNKMGFVSNADLIRYVVTQGLA